MFSTKAEEKTMKMNRSENSHFGEVRKIKEEDEK